MKKKYYYFIIIIFVLVLIIIMNKTNKSEDIYIKEVSVENVSKRAFIETSIKAKGILKLKNNSIFRVQLDEPFIVDEILIDDGIFVEYGTPFIRGHYINELASVNKLSEVDMKIKEIEQVIRTLTSRIELKKEEIENYKVLSNEKINLIEEQIVQEDNKYEIQVTPKAQYIENIESLNIRLTELKNEYDKTLELLKLELDDFMFKLNTEQANIASLKDYKKRLLDHQEIGIKAPTNGYLYLSENIKVNAVCNKYEAIANLYDVSKSENFYVEINLTESDYKKLSDNASGIIYLDDFEGTKLKGNISKYTPIIYRNNGLNYYIIRMNVNEGNPTKQLINNMPVSVEINSKIKIANNEQNPNYQEEYLLLPSTAIVNRDNKNVVFEYKKSDTKEEFYAEKHIVEIIFTMANEVFIKSDKLDENSKIITTGNYDLIGGEKVTIDDGVEGGNFRIEIDD